MNKSFNEYDKNNFFFHLFKKTSFSSKQQKNNQEVFIFTPKDSNKINVLRIKPISFTRIKNITFRQYTGLWTGRILNGKEKSSRGPVKGGLSCPSVFGPQRNICLCGRSKIRNFPLIQKKIRRLIIFTCEFCTSQTIYINVEKKPKLLVPINFGSAFIENGYEILQ